VIKSELENLFATGEFDNLLRKFYGINRRPY